MHPHSAELRAFIDTLADEARAITLKHFRQPIDIEHKADESPVTVADKACEARLRALIKARYPAHAIIGEEYGEEQSASPYRWILDPIDGTRSFISGFPIYCTLIALLHENTPLVSLIDMPVLNERFTAAHDEKTTLNGKPVTARRTTQLDQAICYSTDPTMFTPAQKAKHEALGARIAEQRYTGDGYSYAMLAAGWIDLVVEAGMKPYDYLPLRLIVEQAGGIITDWQGKALDFDSNGEVIAAATPELHQQALSLLN